MNTVGDWPDPDCLLVNLRDEEHRRRLREPHGRHETERLIEGFEGLPTVPVHYRGSVGREFDLHATLRYPRMGEPVVGMPHEKWGEAPQAFVVLRPPSR